jgi:hypothetical protein
MRKKNHSENAKEKASKRKGIMKALARTLCDNSTPKKMVISTCTYGSIMRATITCGALSWAGLVRKMTGENTEGHEKDSNIISMEESEKLYKEATIKDAIERRNYNY